MPEVCAVRGGRERSLGSYLTRADTPHGAPVAPVVDVAGIQATTVVVQAVLEVATARSSRPPVAVGAVSEERATEVEATIDRREGGDVASNAVLFIVGR